MMYPPSLADEVRNRSFQAHNGELGVPYADAVAFLRACRSSGVEVLGWELWIVDHHWGLANRPVPALGSWCGGIPLVGENLPSVVAGDGNAAECERQLAQFSPDTTVEPEWLSFVRVNFTLAD
jgi:hypothetical protein